MNGYYTNNENGLKEARNIISQKSSDELTRLMNNDDEIAKFVGNLNEVRVRISNLYSILLIFRFNKWKYLKKI